MEKYEKLIFNGHITEAFDFFIKNNTPPEMVLKNFPYLCPIEYLTNENRHLWISSTSHNIRKKAHEKNIAKNIKRYINHIKQKKKDDNTLDDSLEKILNVFLLECEALTNPDNLINFIKNTPFLSTETSYHFLISYNLDKPFYLLCNLNEEHEKAIEYMKTYKKIDDLIKYVQESKSHCSLVCKGFFRGKELDIVPWVDKYFPQRAAELFCSPNLNQEDAEECLVYIFRNIRDKENKKIKNIDTDDTLIHFLFFCVNKEPKLDKNFLANIRNILCYLYVKKLRPIADKRKDECYIHIEKEKEPIRGLRKGLYKVISLSKDSKINDLTQFLDVNNGNYLSEYFIEERLLVMTYVLIEDEFFDKCIDIACRTDIKFSSALELCEKAIKMRNSNLTIFYTKLISKLDDNGDYESYDKMIYLINTKNDQLDLEYAFNKLPNEVFLKEIDPFLKTITIDSVNELRELLIENALLELTLKKKKEHIKNCKKNFVEITEDTTCSKCGKAFDKKQIISLHSDNRLYCLGNCLNET